MLNGIDPGDIRICLKAWEKHLKKVLSFPFEAKVFEDQGRGPLQPGDRLQVQRISLVDDLYGIIVDEGRRRSRYACPLCDLEVVKKKSPNYQPVQDYCVWFANR